MRRFLGLALLVPMTLALLPGAAGQGEQEVREGILEQEGDYITFYGHIFNVGRGNPMPMNTQFPDGGEDYSRGVFGPCGPQEGDCEDAGFNENYWYTTAGFVQTKQPDDFSYEDLHNERGQTKDLFFDTSKPIEATYYMSADWHAWLVLFGEGGMAWNWDPGHFEDWVVRARAWHGPLGEHQADPSTAPSMGPIASGSEDFTLMAEGRDGPKPLGGFGETVPAVGAPTVTPFDIELEWQEEFLAQDGIVPKQNDVIMEFEWFQETEGVRYIISTVGAGVAWNVNSGEAFPPTVDFPVRNPLDVELVFPQFLHEKMVILGVVNAPWGSYDVNLDETRLVIRDEDGQEVPIDPQFLQSDADVSVAHTGHFNPVKLTWVWDYAKQGLDPGDYTATVESANFQGSYSTSTVATFTIEDDGLGREAQAGQSGLSSFNQHSVSQFQENTTEEIAGTGGSRQGVDPEGDESEDSPGLPLVAVAGLIGLAAVLRRWRK